MWIWLALQIFGSFLALVVTRVLWKRWKYDLHRIPSPPTLPFLFESFKVLKSTDKGELSQLRARWWKKLGCPKISRFSFAGLTRLYVTDMECARNIVMSHRDPIPRTSANAAGFHILLGKPNSENYLSNRPGVDPYVKAVRKVYTTAFQSSNLKLALPEMKSVINKAMEIVEEKREAGAVDFQDLCVRLTLDVIGSVAYGTNFGGLDGSRKILELLLEAGYILVQRIINPATIFALRFFPKSKRISEQNRAIEQLGEEWRRVAEEIRNREDPAPGAEPVWYGLKDLVDPDTGKRIDIETMRAEIGVGTLGGMDTTGHQLAWLLAIISVHPKVEQKLLEELKGRGLVGAEAREVEFDDLGELRYLNAVVKEGMRVASISTSTFPRELDRDMTILGYRLPKGTKVVLAGNRFMNSEADWGPDPEAFKPERWLAGEDMSQKYYLAFSVGPRDCVGQRLAMTEMKMALIFFLRSYRLSLTVPYERLIKNSRNGVAIEVRDGIWFNVTPRAAQKQSE